MSGDFVPLVDADQLKRAMEAQEAFVGFDEAPINFAPTYRYERGNRKYTSAKMRVPSYCDRILKRTLPGVFAGYRSYAAVDSITSSDHSPVTATIRAGLTHTRGLRSVKEISLDGIDNPELEVSREVGSDVERSKVEEGSKEEEPLYEIEFFNLSASGLPVMDGVRQGAATTVAQAAQALYGSISSTPRPPDTSEERDVSHVQAPVGLCDAYVVFHGDGVAELESGEYATETVPASQEPTWTESIRIPLEDFVSALVRRKYIVLTVMDEDVGSADEVVGSAAVWIGDGWVGDSDGESGVEARSNFERDIMLAGKKCGTVRGDFIVRRLRAP